MKNRYPRLFALLAAGALAFAVAARAEAPPGFRSLLAEGNAALGKEDWPGCARLFSSAAEIATADRSAARARFGAAICQAASGDKEGAFASLDKAAAKGYRELDRAVSFPELEPLRSDPRWKTFVDGVKARSEAHAATLNAELTKLFEQDQADRDAGSNPDWNAVAKRDAERRKRVKEIVAQGGCKQADDYYHAAMVLQHSSEVEDFKLAHDWCLEAVKLDPELHGARWLAAASLDRYLMRQGKPQRYGTQHRKEPGKPWILWDVDPTVTDAERAEWEVPSLAEARAQVAELNTSFDDLVRQGSDFYAKGKWDDCAGKFIRAADATTDDRLGSGVLLRAATCAARAGYPMAVDFAFYVLSQAVARGCSDADRLATDPDYAVLRKDPRWQPLFEKVQARARADAPAAKGASPH